MSRGTIRRIAIALAAGGALLASYPAVSGGALLWDLGAAGGYICLILFVCLYVFPVRGDGLPHARLLALSQHKVTGWYVLVAACAHAALVLLAEPLSARYLLTSAPWFMWCGIAALLSLMALVISGLSARGQMRRQPSAPTTSRATLHVVLASVLMTTACAHIIGSSQLLSGTLKLVIVLLLLALPLAWYALRPRSRPPCNGAPAPAPAAPAHVGAQPSSPKRWRARPASHIAAVAVIALLPAAKRLLLEPASSPSLIAVSFPHELHTSVSCVACHHNYVDHTGTTACIECHRSARADLSRSSESTFHTFCRDCHTQLAVNSEKHGPTRSCAACHQGIRSNNL